MITNSPAEPDSRPPSDDPLPGFRFEHTPRDGDQYARLKPGVLVPLVVEGPVTVETHPDTTFGVRLRFDTEANTYLVEKLTISDARGVSVSDLHSYSIPTLTKRAASAAVMIELDEVSGDKGKYDHFENVMSLIDLSGTREAIRAAGPTDRTLWLVALIYAHAKAVGANPNSTVTSTLAIPKRTATRWIARARELDLLDG